MIKNINKLERCVSMDELLKQGIVSEDLVRALNLYKTWDALVKQGVAKNKAYSLVSRRSGFCVMTIKRAVKKIKGDE